MRSYFQNMVPQVRRKLTTSAWLGRLLSFKWVPGAQDLVLVLTDYWHKTESCIVLHGPAISVSLFFLQNVHLLPRQQDLLLPHWHQPLLTPPAVPWEEDRTGHSRRSPRHQPASRQSGAPADPARLHAKNSPLQLQGTCKAGPALMNHTMIGVGNSNMNIFHFKIYF